MARLLEPFPRLVEAIGESAESSQCEARVRTVGSEIGRERLLT
jgi:hypothetical protein